MANPPLISVVINNYNYGRFLRDAVDSAVGQTYPFVEVIIVDDGSTDNSRQVISTYKDLVQPVLKENGGQASAFNEGFQHCRGEYVIFLDSDDVLLPGTCELVVNTFLAHPDAAKLQYRMMVIDVNGVSTGVIKPPPHMPLLSGDLRRHYLTFPDDVVRMATSANAFPSHVLRQVFPVPEQEYRAGADTYLVNVTPLFGPVISLQEVGAHYRVHGSNNYEVTELNLDRTRHNIIYGRQTHEYIQKFASQLGLYGSPAKPRPILPVSYVSKRMVSKKLDPHHHPIPGDNVWKLFWLGASASSRRFDVSPAMRLLYVFWFAAMLPAPRPLARWLAEMFAFPQKRRQLNRLLGKLETSGS